MPRPPRSRPSARKTDLKSALKPHTTDTAGVAGPGPQPRTVRTPDGKVISLPADWILVPPGDAALTRRLKAAGETWTVQEKKGRRTFSLGVWAPAGRVAEITAALESERATESYAKKREAGVRRRERVQTAYVEDFAGAVTAFLAFAPQHRGLAERFAAAVTAHATPVGSGTVARTGRIPIERRAEAAVIAWMRHQTTAYDDMAIARVKGQRREVRRRLAEESRRRLHAYRAGQTVDTNCPLRKALEQNSVPLVPGGGQ